MSRPILLVPAPSSALVPVGFEEVPALPRRDPGRFPMLEARRNLERTTVLGGRVAVIVGRTLAGLVAARGVMAEVSLHEWCRTQRRDAAGDLRVLRYAVVPFDAREGYDDATLRTLTQALNLAACLPRAAAA